MRGRASSRRAASSASGCEASAKPPADLAQHDAAAAERVAQLAQRLRDVVLGGLQRVGQLVDRDGLGREEQQRLDQAREAGHDGTVRETASRRGGHARRVDA